MAVIRNTSSARRVGRVGNTTYYVANGQQIARQSRNDSNYGVDASRSRAQQMRRVRWSNLVNVYKACRGWMPKAFESKKTNQSDYNKFMSLNINSSTVYLTKDQAVNGCAVMANYIVSQGSLPPINYQGEGTQGTNVVTSIKVGNIPISGSTVAEITSAILSNNPEFQDGDNIAVVLFKTSEPKAGYPYTSASYAELTLDSKSTKTLASLPVGSWLDVKSSALAIKSSLFDVSLYQCVAVIHTRKIGGQLMTSTQHAYCNITDYWDDYANDDALEAAIQSYGVTEDVPLDPSFRIDTIASVAINGVVRTDLKGNKIQVTGITELTVNVDVDSIGMVAVEFNGMQFTPLSVDGGLKYLITSNGIARILINGLVYGVVDVSGIVRPDDIGNNFLLVHLPSTTFDYSAKLGEVRATNADFVNYKVKATQAANHFLLQIFPPVEVDEEAFTFVGCTLDSISKPSEGTLRYSVKVVADTSAYVSYIMYGDFVIAVFNY